MKLSKSTTSNIIAVLLTVAIFVLAWKIVLPNYFSHKNNLTNLENEVTAAKAKLDSLQKAKSDMAAVKSTADQIMVSVPVGKDEPNLISELEAIGIKNNITIPTMDISTPVPTAVSTTPVVAQTAAAPATVSQGAEDAISGTGTATAATAAGTPFEVSFTVKGSFAELNSFILGLEQSVRFMNIKSFTYEVVKGESINSLALQIEVYQK